MTNGHERYRILPNMAASIERMYRETLSGISPKDPHYEFLVRHFGELEQEIQFDYLDFDKFPTSEAEVKSELARQADKYIKFGLNKHPEIRMTRGKFKDSLVALARPQPENFTGRFTLPIAALGQVPAKDVYEAAGVKYWLAGLNVQDWPEDPKGYITPHSFYLAWMDDGAKNLKRKVEDIRLNLRVDARGSTESDGSGFYVAHPRILEHHSIDLPGTVVERDGAPYLHLFGGRRELSHDWIDDAHPRFGSALSGRD